MVEGGPIDVLTGDYLAELTMLILWKAQQKDPSAGYARTVLSPAGAVLGTCLDRGIKIVNNAGGLNPAGLAGSSRRSPVVSACTRRIAYVTGDDLLPRLGNLLAAGQALANLDTGRPLGEAAGQTGDRQRLPRRLGHRRGPGRRRRHRRLPAGHRRLAGHRARRLVARLAPGPTSTSWPGRSSPAT